MKAETLVNVLELIEKYTKNGLFTNEQAVKVEKLFIETFQNKH